MGAVLLIRLVSMADWSLPRTVREQRGDVIECGEFGARGWTLDRQTDPNYQLVHLPGVAADDVMFLLEHQLSQDIRICQDRWCRLHALDADAMGLPEASDDLLLTLGLSLPELLALVSERPEVS